MKVAFQGEPGAYSEEALRSVFPHAEVVPCARFHVAMEALVRGEVDRAVLPLENSQAGSIVETYDLLLAHQAWIVRDVDLRVSHCLMALPGQSLAELRTAHSHPQALAQTDEFLRANGLTPVAETDTAGSARMISEQQKKGAAAIASATAAARHGLEILARGIETNPDNRTRFAVLARTPYTPTAAARTSLVLALKNVPGALLEVLKPFAAHGLNVTKLESRPKRGAGWEYVFHLDVDGRHDDGPLAVALAELKDRAEWVRVLGSYDRR